VLERKLQQRLVGILVLAAFVLLIAPVLFDGEGRIPEKITHIPPQPKRPDMSHIKSVESIEDKIPPLPTIEEVEIAAKTDDAKVIETKQNSSNISANLWSVQVASFRDVKKASAFRDKIRASEFKVYVREKALSDGSIFTQVFVGPVDTKDKAESLKKQVKSKFGEQGLVVQYRQ